MTEKLHKRLETGLPTPSLEGGRGEMAVPHPLLGRGPGEGGLFSPCSLGPLTAANRFVAQPMESNSGTNGGHVTQATIDKYKQLAAGLWGVVVVEAISVTPHSLARKNALVLNRETLDGFKRLVDEMKQINPSVIVLFQITHSGRNSNAAFSEKTTVVPRSTEGRLLDTDEIQTIFDLFVSASLLAEEAGADGVDFKSCHGYFLGEMMRPENLREDRWGGSFENRTRFFREGVEAVLKQRRSRSFIVGSRFSMYEGWRGGCGTMHPDSIIEELEEMERFVQLISSLGMDYANVSAGIPGRTSEITRPVKGAEWMYLHHLRYTKLTRDLLNQTGNRHIKVIGSAYSVLKERAFDVTAEMIEKGHADFVGWGRQILADPLTPKKRMDGTPIDYCLACSGCSKLMIKQTEVGCIAFNPHFKEIWKQTLNK